MKFHPCTPITSHHLLVVCLAMLPRFVDAALPGTINYNLVNDWSDTQNPSGAWSYNYNDSPITTYQGFWWGQPSGWGDNYLADGAIVKGTYPTGINDPFGGVLAPPHDWQPGDVMMHALSIPYGGGSTFLNVKWTSPADGMINLSGRAWDGEIFSDRDVAWSLIVGGQTVASRSSVIGLYRNDADAQFNSNLASGASLDDIAVTQGEVVEFRVMTDTYYGHFVGIQEEIALTPVPEPAISGLFGMGLTGLWFSRRYFRRSVRQP